VSLSRTCGDKAALSSTGTVLIAVSTVSTTPTTTTDSIIHYDGNKIGYSAETINAPLQWSRYSWVLSAIQVIGSSWDLASLVNAFRQVLLLRGVFTDWAWQPSPAWVSQVG